MKRQLLAFAAVLTLSALSGGAQAILLPYVFSGEFPACGSAGRPCGSYAGSFTIDTAATVNADGYYPLASGTVTVKEPPIVYDSNPEILLVDSNIEAQEDALGIFLNGGLFKLFLYAPSSTISDTLLTETNVLAMMNASTSKLFYCKGCRADIVYADTLVITATSVPEPATLALLGLGLAGLGFSRRKKQLAA